MKKLLSICFLSILLGLFSFGVRAQNDNGCTSGFWIENLQPDIVPGVVNMPPTGELPLVHTLGHFYVNDTTILPGNAVIGNTELYELHFCPCGLDPKTKVSIDWVLIRQNENGEWVEVNDNLSNYAEFGIYTFYNQLNQYGECQSIKWLGGRVLDEHGYCDFQGIGTGIPLLDTIYGVNGPCFDPQNYPGAMHVEQGFPMAIQSQLGNINPAAGYVGIYSQNHDYFYLDFFEQARHIVVIKWRQVGNYKLVMRVRQRLGGTPFNNEYWKWENGVLSQTDYVGGHQSCCGPVLVEDTIGRPDFGELLKEVCTGGSFDYGRPEYHFDVTMPDTNVVFGEYRGVDPSACHYFHTDSINRLHFFVRETPVVQTQNIAICKCTTFGQNELNALVTMADTANKGVVDVRFEWSTSATGTFTTTIPTPPTAVGTYTYYVRQVNIYQTIECEGPAVPVTLTINEIPAPTGGLYEICNESTQTTMTLTVNRDSDINNCSTTSVWFLNGEAVHTGDTYNVTLADIRPATNIDQDVVYHVRAYNATTDCYSAAYSVVTVRFHQTPEIVISNYYNPICPSNDFATFRLNINSTQTDAPYRVIRTIDFYYNSTTTSNVHSDTTLGLVNDTLTTTYSKPHILDFICDSTYHIIYRVNDSHGCFVEETVTFLAKDTIPPVVEPATWTATYNQCDFEGANRPDTIKTLAGFIGLANIYDECEEIANFTVKDSTYNADDTCEKVLVRTYTFYDNCANSATFTQTFIAHDQDAPYFVGTPNRPIYERLQPKRAMGCTFNSLSKAEFVMAFLGKVQDNCVEYDSAYLYDHAEFYWEESSRFGHVFAYDSTDIFRDMVGNQLTVEVVVRDGCGNEADTLAFWFEPDTLIVPNVTVDHDICLGDTAFLSFDSTLVDFGYHFDLAHPLTFRWGCKEGDSIINFGDTGAVNTYVVPSAAGIYHVNMTVTDFYGCSNSSEYDSVDVHAAPNIVIIPHEDNACQPPYTYIPGQHIIWHGSYSPNVGIVWLAARDASNPSQTIPGLTYQWTTSQSVNILSVEDTTGLWIVPDSCTYTYDAQVMVTDLYGCTAVDSIWVPVKDTVPEYTGGIHHDIRPLEEECRMTVGDFTHYVEGNLSYFCGHWPPKAIWQEPAYDEELTQDTDVTVYVVSQCGEDTLAITDKFRALVYPDRIHVHATVTPSDTCEPAMFNFNATSSLAIGDVTYYWTKGADTMSHSQAFSNIEYVEEGASTSVYVYQVTAIDAVNCVATDTVSVTVHETLPIPDYEVFPNTRCVELYNGLIRLKNMPKGYSYKLYYDSARTNLIDSIITQIPAWDDSVPVTSIIFDELAGPHRYWVLITTDFGCETFFPVDVDEVITYPEFHGEIDTIASTYCTANGNGQIIINAEAGYTYYVFDANGNEILYPYENLAPGSYTVIKENDTTECSTPITVTIISTNGFTFTVTPTANTHCVAPFSGKLAFTKANVWFVVTDLTEGEIIYAGPSTTLTGLHAGQYSVFGTDTITGCTKTVNKTITSNTQNPTFTVAVHPNQYCANFVNGSLLPNPAATYTYQYDRLVAGVWEAVADNTHLAAGHYRVIATNTSGCTTTHVYDIVDSVIIPEVIDSTVVNTICDTAVAPGHSYDGKVILTITNYNADFDYTVILGEDTVVAEAAVVEFNGLNAGVYNYKVIDNFYCEYEGEVEVAQQELQALILKQTPNTYCVGTYNKPGNGTITVMAPYDEVEYYYYSYYYAYYDADSVGQKGGDVEVDYDNLINRFYWLVDTFYYVEVMDLRTGCIIADTITVQLGRDTVLLTGDPTPNVNCIAPFNGEIQLHASYIPAEFDYSHLPLEPVNIPQVLYPRNRFYKYSIDGGLTYQYDSLFTNLEDGVYYFTVYDTISGCVYNDFDSIVVEKAPNDITINHEFTPNHACVDSLIDGTLTVSATTTTFDSAEFRFVLDHGTDTTGVVTTWTYTSLSGFHTITAIEIHSGCEVDSTFEVPTDDNCNTQIDVDLRKYCLNEENAQITATATSDCEGDFSYRWHKECHNTYYDSASVPVATDQEMCCFYTVTATNNATGCPTSRRVEVCVYATHPIQYTVDLNPLPIPNNSTVVCENEPVTIGIVHNGWAQSWWTMNHVTDTTVINPEYEFLVSTADSVAAYASDPNKWKFNRNISFCLDVIDTNGCHAQGLFNLVVNPLVRETVDIEICDIFSDDPALDDVNDEKMMNAIGEADLADLYAGTAEYPYVIPSFNDTIVRTEGCDSIVTYNITILGVPTIDAPEEVASYCYGVKLSDIMENVTINNAADTTYYVNGDMVDDMNYVFAYSVDPVSLIITCSSGNPDCAAEHEINFYVDSIPAFTGELEIDTLCAGNEIEIDIPTYDCNQHDDACTVDVILVDSTDVDNVVVTTLAENIDTENPYLLDPIKMSYNGKYFGFIVKNVCGEDTILAQLVVDTIPEGIVRVGAICANQTLTSSWEITNGVDPDEVTATPYVKMPGSDVFVEFDINQEIDYSYNGARLYYVLTNHCGEYITPDSAIVVNDKPTIVLNPDDLMLCVSEFDANFNEFYCGNTGTGEPLILQPQSPTPGAGETGYVLPNSTDTILAHGWLLVVDNAGEITYEAVTAAQIKEMAKDTIISIMYYATNACGSDTVGAFQIGLSDVPEIEAEVNATMCPTSVVGDVVTYDVTWHSATGTDGDVIYKVFADEEAISETTGTVINPETTTFNDILTYNGGKLLVIAVSAEECGNDTVDVDLNIPTWDPVDGEMQSACRGSQFSAFIVTAPTLTIDVATIDSQAWYVVSADAATDDAEIGLNNIVNTAIEVYYKWVTSCGDVITTAPVELQILDKPTVVIDDITICAGDNVNIANANLNVTDPSNVVNGDATWTINGEVYSATATYGVDYDNTDIVVTVPTDCGSVTATATLHVNAAPVVEVAGEDICSGSEATFTATPGYASYTFTLGDEAPVTQTSNVFTQVLDADATTLTSFYTVTVSAVDEFGCASSADGSATIKVTSAPQFTFMTLDGTETHEFEANTGEQYKYIWMVGGDCNEEDLLVYVEYDIYYEGELLTLNNISSHFCIQNTSANGTNRQWNTSNSLLFYDSDNEPISNTSYYLGATPNDFNIYNYYGNHFPYSSLVHNYPTSNYYDDLWMHFLRNREITQTVAPFKQDGDYKFVFRLFKTNRPNNFQNILSDLDVDGTICPDGYTDNGYPALGGTGFNTNFADGTEPTLTLLALDSIMIHVQGPEYDCTPVTSPELAPNVTVEEANVAPDMEVWPNPAPAITTTLKARVHNMSGEATVTLTTLGGTQVYSGKTFIDSDNYYFEFGVNNLSVGTYIMTVRTGDAIINKKVVVSSLGY